MRKTLRHHHLPQMSLAILAAKRLAAIPSILT
jgi:hypothetical protein